jgi:hypothetical protein
MSTWSFESVVRQDQIKLPPNVHLPDDTKVVVTVQADRAGKTAHLYSPRLANPAQAADFVLEVIEESADA